MAGGGKMRPIALTDNLAKTQAAERINQIQKAQGEMEQRQAAEAQREQVAANLQKTRENEQPDMVIIRKEQEQQKKKQQQQKRKKKADDRDEEDRQEHLDLKG
jgi:hypothetical protein